MAGFTRIALAFFLAAVQLPAAFALDDAPATISQELVPFSSDEGLTRLARSTAKVDFPDLTNQFEAESNGAFCGPTSAAIVLNAVRGRSADLPRDRSRLRPEDLQYIPSAYDPTLPRFTQDNVITKGQKTRAQVLGEPVTINILLLNFMFGRRVSCAISRNRQRTDSETSELCWNLPGGGVPHPTPPQGRDPPSENISSIAGSDDTPASRMRGDRFLPCAAPGHSSLPCTP